MSKRILSLVLCMLMLCGILASCGKTDLDKAQDVVNGGQFNTGDPYATLSFYMICEQAISEQHQKAMQDAFNKAISKYNTRVEFTFITKDKYEEELDQAFVNIEQGNVQKPSMSYEQYPELKAGQVDIYFNLDFNMMERYITANRVADLTEFVQNKWRDFSNEKTVEVVKNSQGEVITDAQGNPVVHYPTISEVIFSSAYYKTEIYEDHSTKDPQKLSQYFGIPSAGVKGSYQYFFVDKTYADRFYYDIESVTQYSKAQEIKEKLSAEIANLGEDASQYIYLTPVGDDYEKRLEYPSDRFYSCVLSKPTFSYQSVFEGMLCVSSRTVSVKKAFEVLYELNTNPALYSIFKYGAEGTTYSFNALTNEITLTDRSYADSIAPHYTGNNFCAYPCISNGESYQSFIYDVLHNSEAVCQGTDKKKEIYLTRSKLISYLQNVYEAKKANAIDDVATGFKYVEEQKQMQINGATNNVTFRYMYKESANLYVVQMSTETQKVSIQAQQNNGGTYALAIQFEDANSIALSTTFAQMPNTNYTITFTQKGADNITYKGTITLEASLFGADTSLEIGKQITLNPNNAEVSDQKLEVQIGTTSGVCDMLDMLSILLGTSGTKLTLENFGFSSYQQ